MSSLLKKCNELGLKMTDQRKVIVEVLSNSKDHPDVELVYKRASEIDKNIGIATVYRTIRLFEENNIIEKHEFKDGRFRYEEVPDEHHDHLIDIRNGKVIEFQNDEIENLQKRVAQQLGYELVDHRLELYGIPIKDKK
jgi:Fur family ferric uptake transcriptional regulator